MTLTQAFAHLLKSDKYIDGIAEVKSIKESEEYLRSFLFDIGLLF